MLVCSDYCYIWQKEIWSSLTGSNLRNNTSGVILITGPRGSGKLFLANNLSKWLLCLNPDIDSPCGECQSCKWMESNSHPDYYDVNFHSDISLGETKVKKSKSNIKSNIKIDDIRNLNNFLSLQVSSSRPKVIVINNIDKLTVSVANSLLKPLENHNIYAVLLSDNYNYILPTIRSRAQRWKINVSYNDAMKDWLLSEIGFDYKKKLDLHWYISGGSPLALLEAYKTKNLSNQYFLVESLLKLQDPWVLIDKYLSESLPLIWVLDSMYYILIDTMKYKINNTCYGYLNLKNHFPDLLNDFSGSISIKSIEYMLKQIKIFKKGFLDPSSIHDDLMLESLFIEWHNFVNHNF